MRTWKLDREGFVCHYLVSGPRVEPIEGDSQGLGQLRAEIRLREAIAVHGAIEVPSRLRAGEDSRLGMPWRFAGGRDGAFVNLSAFYPGLCRVRFDAAACLVAPRAMEAEAVVWSYAAADVYLNGEKVGQIDKPVYKPISRLALKLPLRAGRNALYLACETLGVRDTRSVVAVQLPGQGERMRATLPDAQDARTIAEALDFIESAGPSGDCLRFACPAPAGTRMSCRGGFEPDFALARRPAEWTDIGGRIEALTDKGSPWITVETPAPGGPLARRFEFTERYAPRRVLPVPDIEENRRLILERVAAVESLNRDGAFGFPISNLIARRALGIARPGDGDLLRDMLGLIKRRVDCADFLVCGLLRYMRSWPLEGELAARARSALLGFRYWMDMEGSDGMCFWSENHSLMFYVSAMLAGELYPGDRFTLAKRTGAELRAWGRGRLLEWLEDVEVHGFEEFLSGVYLCVTFAALLNVIDYAEPELSARAARVADRLLEGVALHTWKGGFIAPMGRVYRGVLYPFSQGVMALANLIDPSQPYDFGEGWLGFYANSGYRVPEGLKRLIDAPASLSYATGNARIVLEKHEDWCLTSVQSPWEPFERWANLTLKPGDVPERHATVKSWNERFHGTTDFRPGVYGYQQHLWYAALDGEAVLFANHPGAASEDGDMRPGYWHGNGVFPALKQEGGLLGMIWRIPREQPLHYIHAYAPECRFDAFERRGSWLLMRRGAGYIGFWTSAPAEPWNGVNFRCERRIYGDEIAALCVCGGREHSDLDSFAAHCLGLGPRYDAGTGTLRAGNFELVYEPGEDQTQYL